MNKPKSVMTNIARSMKHTALSTLNHASSFLAKIPSRLRIVAIGAFVVIAVGVGILVGINKPNHNGASLQGEHGMITLQKASKNMAITNGTPIEGLLKPQKDASLYYIVSSEDKHALGAGNITFSNGKFSRNLTFVANGYKKGELQVYLQDKEGKVIDHIITNVTLR